MHAAAPPPLVIPAQAGIQYAAAYRFYHWRLWDTGSPAFAGDDSCGCVLKRSFAISRLVSPELCRKILTLLIRGRRECRAPDAPDSRVCNNSGRAHTR